MDYVALPRRHSPRTLGLLLRWYFGAGLLGMIVALFIGAILALLGATTEPKLFGVVFVVALPIFSIGLFLVWHRVVHPLIQLDRDAAHQAVDDFINRRRL
jgi:fatty acid desaturase